MKLTEFEKGTGLVLISTKRYNRHEFDSEIIMTNPDEDTVLAKPVLVNGRMVRFSDPEINHTVTVIEGSKVYTYPDVSIREVETSSRRIKYALCIESDEDAEPVNRRNFFRVYLGVGGILQTSVNHRVQEVVIKDISASGLGVICARTLRIPVGTNVYVTFVDELTGEEFKVDCTVVRCVKNDEETVIYGCELPESSDSMEKLVALKQRIH